MLPVVELETTMTFAPILAASLRSCLRTFSAAVPFPGYTKYLVVLSWTLPTSRQPFTSS